MTDYFEEQQERDKEFVDRLYYAFDMVRVGFREWTSREAKELQTRLNSSKLPPFASDFDAAQELLKMVEAIDLHEVPEANNRVKERMEEIKKMMYDSPLESYLHSIDSYAAIERAMRRLLEIRAKLSDEQ